MKRGWLVLLALSVGLNVGLLYVHLRGSVDDGAGVADSQPRRQGRRQLSPHGHPEGPSGFIRDRLGRIGARLSLDEEQRKGMAAVLDDMMPRILAKQEVVRETQGAIRMEYMKPQIDREKILQLQRQGSLAQAQLDSLVAETMLREALLLSPDQRSKYFELMPWKEKRERGAGMRRGRGRSR
jgi:Spy/CpxP family protein refolding chaperone